MKHLSNYLQLSTTGKLHIQLTPRTVTPTNYMTWIVSRFPSGVRVRRLLLNIPHIPHDIHPSLITGTNKKLFCLLSLPVGHGRYAGSSTFINILKSFLPDPYTQELFQTAHQINVPYTLYSWRKMPPGNQLETARIWTVGTLKYEQ